MANTKKQLLFAVIIAVLGMLAALFPQMLALEESIGLHLLFQWRGPRPAPPDVVVVALDRQSSKVMDLPMEPRKWPRTVHAGLVDRLVRAGAAVIVFDLIFNEPQSPETDGALADAIHRAGNVVLAQSLLDETVPVVDAEGRLIANVNIEKMVPPIPPLAGAALAQAPFPVPKVPIKLHRVWTFRSSGGDIPTLPVMAFHIYAWDAFCRLATILDQMGAPFTGLPLSAAVAGYAGDGGLDAIHTIHTMRVVLRQQLPSDQLETVVNRQPEPIRTRLHSMLRIYRDGSSRFVDFYGPAEAVRTIPYHRLMAPADGDLKAFDLRGKAVFVGQTESYWPRAKDGFFTVYARDDVVDVSGVEIAATVFANLVEDRAVTPLVPAVQLGLIFFLGFLMALVSCRLPAALAGAATLALAGCYLVIAQMQFRASGLWLPIVLPVFMTTPLAYFSALILKYRSVSRERRIIRKAFGYYLPDAVVDQLSRNIHAIQSDRKVVYSICLFTDAEKYTRLSESLDPQRLTDLMNQYYEAIFKPIRDHGGLVLQVVGDSVLSLWTATQADPGLRRKACSAALAVAQAVEQFNQRGDGYQLPTRIGLHAGEVVLGNIGAMDHFEYRPVGDIVNTASRLEGLNKYLGTRILASGVTLDQLDGFVSRYLGQFLFEGKSNPVAVYALQGGGAAIRGKQDDAWRSFAKGMLAFARCDWNQARSAFEQCLAIGGPDGPSEFYLKLCDTYQQTPPGEGWDGTIHLTHK